MAIPTVLTNQKIRNQAALDTEVVGANPAMAMGNYYMSTSTALSQAAMNATFNQNISWMISNAVTYRMLVDMKLMDMDEMNQVLGNPPFA